MGGARFVGVSLAALLAMILFVSDWGLLRRPQAAVLSHSSDSRQQRVYVYDLAPWNLSIQPVIPPATYESGQWRLRRLPPRRRGATPPPVLNPQFLHGLVVQSVHSAAGLALPPVQARRHHSRPFTALSACQPPPPPPPVLNTHAA